jgi:hypothetical protein
MAPDGRRLVEELLAYRMDPAARCSTPDEALEALNASIQDEEA